MNVFIVPQLGYAGVEGAIQYAQNVHHLALMHEMRELHAGGAPPVGLPEPLPAGSEPALRESLTGAPSASIDSYEPVASYSPPR